MLLSHLHPASFILSTLSLLVASSPLPVANAAPELRQLTGTNFKQETAHNDWFIEFFSPYCGHCTAFKPTWEKLVTSREDSPRLNLAQVNCVAEGDLCTSEGVKYYPNLQFYRNHANGTQTKETYSDSRTLENLESWLDARSPKPAPIKDHPVPAYDGGAQQKVEKSYGLEGKVQVLTSDTFAEKVASEPTFVKFYAPWCGHCQKLAPKWVELAEELKGVVNIAEINCDSHGAVCRNAGIEGYPTLAFYLNGKKIDYTGSKNVPTMATYIRKAMAPGVTEVDTKKFNAKLADEEVVFLLLHSGSDNSVVNIIASAAQTLLGDPQIYASTSPALYTQYGLSSPTTSTVPVLLAIKNHSTDSYSAKLELDGLAAGRGQGNSERLEKWMQRNRFPYVSKLSMDNFYSVMKNPTSPFVVLLAVDPGTILTDTSTVNDLSPAAQREIKNLEEISKAWSKEGGSKDKERETVFVWMDGGKWGKWLGNIYGIKDVERHGAGIVVVDHGALLYYDHDAYDRSIQLSKESVFSALTSIYAGKGKPKHSENMLERVARSVNNKVLALEAYIKTHVKTTILGVVVFFVLLFYAFKWCIDSDVASTGEYYVSGEEKRERGRLD